MLRNILSARRRTPPALGRRHASHTRARSRGQHGFPGAHQCAPGRQHVPGVPPSVVEQRYSRHSRHRPRKTRSCEHRGRRPLKATRTPRIDDAQEAAIVAYPAPPSRPAATTTCLTHLPPWWASSRAATAASALSNHDQSDVKKRRPKSAVTIMAISGPRSQRTLQSAVRVRERDHAYSSRRHMCGNFIRHHTVTGRRYTRVIDTPLRLVKSRF